MKIIGTVHSISESQVISDKLTKREVIIMEAENPQYPQYLKFEVANDKCKLLDGLKVDQSVNVSFNLKGRIANNGNCYNTLQAFKVEVN
jgi:hypothetical protein